MASATVASFFFLAIFSAFYVTYSEELSEPLCHNLAVPLGSNFTYTDVNCTRADDGSSGSGDFAVMPDGDGAVMQWELIDTGSGCTLSGRNGAFEESDLGSVANCSGRYRYNCNDSSRTTTVNLCIVDIKLVVESNSVTCKISFGWDYCSKQGNITVKLSESRTLDVTPLHESSGVYRAVDPLPGLYVCSVTVFDMMVNSTPAVGYYKKISPPEVAITVNNSNNEIKAINVTAGGYIVLHCSASLPHTSTLDKSSVMIYYSWIKPDRAVHELPNLILDDVTVGQSGVYTCKARFGPSSLEDFLNASDTNNASILLNITEVKQPESPQIEERSNLDAIVGSAIGCVGFSLLLFCLIIFCCYGAWRSRRRRKVIFDQTAITYVNPATLASPLIEDTEPSVDVGENKQAMELEKMDTGKKGGIVSIRDFPCHVKTMHQDANRGFEEEFESLPISSPSSFAAARLPSNVLKNRFENIYPYDFCRVKLEADDEDSDYINASFLDGYDKTRAYIAAQGPMENTVGDFWQMVWEYKLPTIVMLTDTMEAGRSKCEQYWPTEVGKSIEPNDCGLRITLSEQRPFAEYQMKILLVVKTSQPEDPPLKVTHLHFTAWPDHGVPDDKTSLIYFIQRTRKFHPYSSEDPVLVHCSAGVGRTGSFIVLDSMMQRMKSEDSLDIYDFLVETRTRRPLMVQTEAQYIFIHDALEEFITCGDTAISTINLRIAMGKLSNSVDEATFEKQFQLLEEVSYKPNLMNCTDGRAEYNRPKNRYSRILPFNNHRVILKIKGVVKGSDYINASFVDGYKHRKAFIATQGPLKDTVEDFWRMIRERECRVIVMLCNLTEEGKECSHRYWPETEGEEQVYGKWTVKLTSEYPCGDFIMRKLNIKDGRMSLAEKAPESYTVTQYHHMNWPETGPPPSAQMVLRMVNQILKNQISTGNHTITVLCNDGVGRTGTFVCLFSQLERIKVENMADVFQYIKGSRIQRAGLVATVEQYQFCHEVLAEYIDSFEQYANFK